MEHTTGEGETTAANGTLRSGMHIHTGAAGEDRAASDGSGYRERLANGVGQLSGRVNSILEDRANIFAPIKKYPLVAVGVAFTVGLALASSRRGTERHWMIERPRRRLRTLLIGTATAALVSELHNLAETDERIRKLLGAYLGDLPGDDADVEDEDYDDFEDYDEDDEDELPPLR